MHEAFRLQPPTGRSVFGPLSDTGLRLIPYLITPHTLSHHHFNFLALPPDHRQETDGRPSVIPCNVRPAEAGSKTRDAAKVALAYSLNTKWRTARTLRTIATSPCLSRAQVVKGTGLSVDQGALGITGNRIVVRYAYEWHADSGNCNESWGFGQDGVMINRFVVSTTCQLLNRIASSTGRVAVDRSDHPSLSELGF